MDSSNHRVTREGGFALPFTVLLLALLTAMLTGILTRAATEHEVTKSSRASVDALTVARNGLKHYFADTLSLRPGAADSIRYNVDGGFAWVFPNLLVHPADSMQDHLYLIRSVGYTLDPNQGSTPQARRFVAEFANWHQGAMNEQAALTAINGAYGTPPVGTTAVVDGTDLCGMGDTTGLRSRIGAVPPPGTTGSPPSIIADTALQVAAQQGIDWATIYNGGFTADYSSVINGDTTFASYLLTGPHPQLHNIRGTGLLIALGELDSESTYFEWDGVILVGGEFDWDADSTIVRGLVVSGLNEQLGVPVDSQRFNEANENVFLYYDSCNVDRALESLRGFRRQANTFFDNWATY